jgi:hypothetical protein
MDIQPYIGEVDFKALADAERRTYFLSLPTNFRLSRTDVQKLIDVGGELLEADPEFQQLLKDLRQ